MSIIAVRISLSLLALAASLSPAVAASREDVTAEVNVADLNLANAEDQARLDSRVKSAAHKICSSGFRVTAAVRAAELRCIETALASVKPQVELAVAKAGKTVRIAVVQSAQGS
jgi:UrcA family protein